MKTMQNWRHLITGLAALTAVSFGSYAVSEEAVDPGKDCMAKQHGFHHPHGKGERHFERMAKTLELTDEQKQTLAAHKDEQRANYREQRKQLRQTQRALQEAVSNNASEAEVAELADKLGDLTAQQVVARVKDKEFMLSILTPEQKAKMEQLKSERKNRWREKEADTKA